MKPPAIVEVSGAGPRPAAASQAALAGFGTSARPAHRSLTVAAQQHLQSRDRQGAVCRVFYSVLAISLLCATLSAQTASPQGYVGSTACTKCHPDITTPFFRNPHFKNVALGESAERAGCETCHGPAKEHVDALGGKSTIVAFSQLAPDRVLDRCLQCHSKTLSRANIDGSRHTLSRVVCTSCHSIHRSPVAESLLAAKEREVCYGCHASVKAAFSMPFKHRVNEGFMECSDCHDPHGAFGQSWGMARRSRMVRQTEANDEPCLKCHREKRGPFAFEHAAVRVDGCEACHQPHGSPNSRLLRRPVVFTLCLECHNRADRFGLRIGGIPIQTGIHNMNDSRFQNCTNCHVKIHGSNTDAFFLR